MKKGILYTFVGILVLIFLSELCSYFYIKDSSLGKSNKEAKAAEEITRTQRYAPVKVYNFAESEKNMRKVIPGTNNKGSIIFFGDGYTWGVGVEENETLPYYVSEKTGRTVINRGFFSGGIYNTLYDVKNENFYKTLEAYPPVEYIIYTYINDQCSRAKDPYRSLTVFNDKNAFYEVDYEFVNNKGEFQAKIPSPFKRFLYSLYTTKALNDLKIRHFAKDSGETRLVDFLVYIKKVTDEKLPGSKFALLQYKDGSGLLLAPESIEKLKQNNIIVLDAEDTAGHELETEAWRLEDKEHPSPAAYNDVAEGLVKNLGL